MTNKKIKKVIAIKQNGKLYPVLTTGYVKDGGFFIKGVGCKCGSPFLTSVLTLPTQTNIGKSIRLYANKQKNWHSMKEPKITHHMDGNAHISEAGIFYGFYKITGKPKGAHVKSMHLISQNNDGGPIATYTCWGLEKLESTSKKKCMVFEEGNFINYPWHKFNAMKPVSYIIEFFYIPKAGLRNYNLTSNSVTFHHPNIGIIQLQAILSPENYPGFLGVFCGRANLDFSSQSGYALNGGPGIVDQKGMTKGLLIFHNRDDDYNQIKKKSIEFRGKNKILAQLDFRLSKLLKKK